MQAGDGRQSYRVVSAGAPLEHAAGAVIMIHGRGATPADILSLAEYFERDDLVYLAPEAPGRQWYPHRFMEPIESNEPGITLGMQAIEDIRERLAGRGIGGERTVLLGFSQGACLALEYAARHAGRFGGVVGLSGGLIGPPGTPRDYQGSMADTPVLLGCSDIDPHIPVQRVHESAEVFTRLGARVTLRIYPAMGHTVNDEELRLVNQILAEIPGK